ncbi:SNF2 family helicase [Nitzschia inconspicua]|uniref:SNF2 family helicase n=1 Tax=Nitzschia inconspicua TaxID=303405 RepID=A0A9K3LJJ2_9STRA|nr:SNF2 family helicase [Nitzschia inconspicua]
MSSSNGGSWLTTKKNQHQIQTSKDEALASRKRRNQRSSTGNRTKTHGTSNTNKRVESTANNAKKKKRSNQSKDDDDDDDEFIVDDDVVEYDSSSEDEYVADGEDEQSEQEDVILDEDNDDDEEEEEDEMVDLAISSTRAERANARKRAVHSRKGNIASDPTAVTANDDDSGTCNNPVSIDVDEKGSSSNDTSSSDDDLGGPIFGKSSFLPSGKGRKSAPSNLLKQNQKVAAAAARARSTLVVATTAKKRRNSGSDSLAGLATEPKKARTLNHCKRVTPKVTQQGSKRGHNIDYDDELLTSPDNHPSKTTIKSSNNLDDPIYLDSTSDEDEEMDNQKLSAPPSRSKYFDRNHDRKKSVNVTGKNKAAAANDMTLEDTPDLPRSKLKKANTMSRRTLLDDQSDCESRDESVEGHQESKTKRGGATLPSSVESHQQETLLVDSESDEEPKTLKRKRTKAVLPPSQDSEKELLLVDSDSDVGSTNTKRKTKRQARDELESEDEDLRAAIYESKRHLKVNVANKRKTNKRSDDEETNEVILLDDSDDDNDGDEHGDDYVDQEKEAASTVLKTAEQLSAHVVRTMSQWFGGGGGGGGKTSENATIQGIIVDGAVSLGKLDVDEVSSSTAGTNHKWIPKEEMARVCPNVTLSNYQLIGVNWLSLLHGMKCTVGKKDTNVNGILADEMGLGKTVQTIAFLSWLAAFDRRDKPKRPHLIAVPVSTLPNWIREFETFAPHLKVVKYHGSKDEREAAKESLSDHHPKYRNPRVSHQILHDVIVVPVNYFQKEDSIDRKFLNAIEYDYLIVDEAHSLKNAKSTRYKMLDRIKSQHRLLLTGTPIQNNPRELLNMLSFIMPLFSRSSSSLDDDNDKGSYTEQMLKHFVDEKLEGQDDHEKAYSKLKQLFAPFVLRRKKDEVIAQLLPPKKYSIEFVELSKSTRRIYDSIIENHVNQSGPKVSAAIGDHLFTNLRKAAHHPLMLRNRHTSDEEKKHLAKCFLKYQAFQGEGCTEKRVAEELTKFSDFHIHLTAYELLEKDQSRGSDLNRYILETEDLFCSSKFERLRTLLPDLISKGHRVLIFSSWTSCLDLLGCLMDHLNLKYQRMDGSIQSDERQRLIDQFNDDHSYSVFLLSTKACGVGLNLTGADTCIIHDLDFNPFNDLQAEDRCHRIGQKKPVTVYKLVTKDTVDSDIYKMQEMKAKMNAAIMGPSSFGDQKAKREITEAAVDRFIKSRNKGNRHPEEEQDEVVLI